eukprot:INCI15716.1.p1 GENE.INCI15716.1~~INCI15716.1.p1  ORF type:complete len:568 (-),score=95.02 INCI15716.1:1653-3356(-)
MAATALPRATIQRLQRDLKQLQKEPLAGAAAEPSDDDLSLWNGVILVPLRIAGKKVEAPLHFRIDFPTEYPNKPPDVGFSTEFCYNMGASYRQPSGRLAGCKVICLDLLGNFANIHTEWTASEGSGWSPAYSVSTLLVNLQSILMNIGSSIDAVEKSKMHKACIEFAEANPDSIPTVVTAREIAERTQMKSLTRRLRSVFSGKSSLVESAVQFARDARFIRHDASVDQFVELLKAVGGGESASAGGASKEEKGGEEKRPRSTDVEQDVEEEEEVDTNIVCYSTGTLYTEGLLGYGISVARRGRQVNLSTPAELLSADAFDGGLRQSTSKAAFELFLPAFINPAHASNSPAWVRRLKASVLQMGKLYNCSTISDAALAVFPKLINTMLADIMSPETSKSAAIAYFEALLSFWRTFHFLLTQNKLMASECRQRLRSFVDVEKCRLKSVTPDVGALFAMYACCPDGAPKFADFIAAYVDEAFCRSVLWWQRNGAGLESKSIFTTTEVGRNIAMLQSLLVRQLIGPTPELQLGLLMPPTGTGRRSLQICNVSGGSTLRKQLFGQRTFGFWY